MENETKRKRLAELATSAVALRSQIKRVQSDIENLGHELREMRDSMLSVWACIQEITHEEYKE